MRIRGHTGWLVLLLPLLVLSGVEAHAQGRPPRPQPRPRAPLPPAPSPGSQLPEISSLQITYFRTTTPETQLGEEQTLHWEISGKNVKNLRLELHPGPGVIPLARTDYSTESFRLEDSRSITPTSTIDYTLKLSGDKIGLGGALARTERTANVRIVVKKPQLEPGEPRVSQDPCKIEFFVKNTGDGRFAAAPVELSYRVRGLEGLAGEVLLANGTLRSQSPLALAPGQQVSLGEISLDRNQALQADILSMNVGLPAYPTSWRLFDHRWETKTMTVNETLIDTLAAFLTGRIHINNFDGSGSDRLGHYPKRDNDSYVEIAGQRKTFTPPYLEINYGAGGSIHWRGFFNDINAPIGDRTLFSITNGQVKITIRFETDGTEIRAYESTGGYYYDIAAPDVDFSQLEIAAMLGPALNRGRLTYAGVEVSPSVSLGFIGAWEAIIPDSIRRNVQNMVRSEIRNQMLATLMQPDLKAQIEDAIDQNLRVLLRHVRLTRLRAQGNSIVVEYL
jgi:hypothetical protein